MVTYLAGCLCVAGSREFAHWIRQQSRHVGISSFETASLFLLSTAQPPLPSSYSCLSSFSLSKRLFALSLPLSPCECALSLSLSCLLDLSNPLPLFLSPFALTDAHLLSHSHNFNLQLSLLVSLPDTE